MLERRFTDRRHRDRGTPDRRLGDRRKFDRWHSTEPLAATFDSGNTRYVGVLRNISVTGCLLESAITIVVDYPPPDDSHVQHGTLTLSFQGEAIQREASLVRHGKGTLALKFTRELGDALLSHIVELCRAYSIQYRDRKVQFVGDLGNLPAILHLLKCIKAGAVVDLSRAYGTQTRAAASMKLLRTRGAQLRGCRHMLHSALELVAPSVCSGCTAECAFDTKPRLLKSA